MIALLEAGIRIQKREGITQEQRTTRQTSLLIKIERRIENLEARTIIIRKRIRENKKSQKAKKDDYSK